ncbi:MAG: hypothetical protein JXB13_17580, partial [Phycisphaerae bacterium]|nr:hypothetical protein [Phycisphaerae bacterium]
SIRDPSVYLFLLMCIPVVAIMAHLCELLIAAGPFALAGAGPHRRYRFQTVRCMLRFTTCHLIVTCVGIGSLMGTWASGHHRVGDVFWPVIATSAVLWWLDLSIMLVTLGRRTGVVVLGILLIPVIGVATSLLGFVTTGMLFNALR